MNTYKRYRYSAEIISHAIWLYHRFTLSFRDIEELLAARHIEVTYETIRQWCLKLAPNVSKNLRKKPQASTGGHWFLGEVFININGKQRYLWRAVDQDNQTIDILVQTRRNRKAAAEFFRKRLKNQPSPNKIITDKLASYSAALNDIGSSIPHDTQQYHNNITEISHQPTRQKERQMRKFKSIGQAQRFLSCHAAVNSCFRKLRHLLKAKHYRCFRERAFGCCAQVKCVQKLAEA